MGVAWVFEYPLGDATSRIGAQAVKEIERQLEAVGAERDGHYFVDSMPYRPNVNVQSGISLVYLLHHSEFPHSTFTIAPDLKERPGLARAVSDRGFDLILGKLGSGLTPDPPGKFECTGSKYVLKDFAVRVGSASMASSFKGVVVEIEYRPLSVTSMSTALMREFVRSVLPVLSAETPTFISRMQAHEQYYPIDTLHQYLDLFLELRKRTTLQPQPQAQPVQPSSFQPPPQQNAPPVQQ
uniref:Mediator of RNA polymerase II transcription subunit 20 n=1 Tax=Plectus sambesii TaxID=2011161 RepID=A0A914VKD8_9BILA